jgi:regulator of protease activity HflC (stomatin/prohibitin superfamily)
MEKTIKPVSGFLALLMSLLLLILAIFLFTQIDGGVSKWYGVFAVLSLLTSIFLGLGIIVISPNHSRVLTFFGKYVGTAKDNGLLFVNPLYKKQKISMRSENLESAKLKVNDKMGNPIEIAAVIVWQVQNTYKAAFEVADYNHYVKVQSEAAIRHLALSCPYDHMEDEHASID